MQAEIKRKSFIIITQSEEKVALWSSWVNTHYKNPTIYTAAGGPLALQKIRNAPVDVVICESDPKRMDSLKAVESMIAEKLNPNLAVILLGIPPEQEHFVDEIVTGQVQFLHGEVGEGEFDHALTSALNFSSHSPKATFALRFLAPGDLLIKEGERADYLYILKNGELEAFHDTDGDRKVIGKINVGEFVGEMALINNAPRSASIEALTDCELIELPVGLVNRIIYSKPSWARALMITLSKRLINANKVIAAKD
jgi:hypothetical protein